MNDNWLSDFIVSLKEVKAAPRMYFIEDVPTVMSFITGIKLVLIQSNIYSDYQNRYWVVAQARGWSFSSNHPFVEMRSKGMGDQEIIQEVLQIEIEILSSLPNV